MNQGKNELRSPSREGSRAAVAAVFDDLEQGCWVNDDVDVEMRMNTHFARFMCVELSS